MKLGSILGVLSPGLSATGLFGHNAQDSSLGMLGSLSPLLALLLHKKKKDGGDGTTPPPVIPQLGSTGQINVTQNPMLRAMGGMGGMMPPPGMPTPYMRPPGGY